MGEKFTRQVLYLHEQLAPEFDIESFVDALDPKAIGLSDKSQFYAPLNFSVQICGGINAPAGAITLAVPVHANPQWLDTMKRRFAKMVGVSGKGMDFRMVNGQSISTITDVDALTRVGKLNFFVDNKLVRLPSMPETPIEYSVTKVPNIQAWYKDMATELPKLVADELINKTAVEVDAAIRPDGPVQRRIERHIASTNNAWTEFVRSHHMNSPDSMSDADAKETLKAIGKEILIEIRRFIAASKPEIDRHIAAVENKKAQKELKAIEGHDSEHYAPLLSVPTTIFAPGKTNGLALYSRLVDDALCSPVLERAVVDTVYNKPIAGCRWDKEPFSKDNTDDTEEVDVRPRPQKTFAPRPTRQLPAKKTTGVGGGKKAPPPPAGMTVERLADGRTYMIPARQPGENDAVYKARVAASNPQVPPGAPKQWWEATMTYLTRERSANSASRIEMLASMVQIGAAWSQNELDEIRADLRRELAEMGILDAFKDSVFDTQKSIMAIVGAMECMRLDFVKRKKEEAQRAAAAAKKGTATPAPTPAPAATVNQPKGGYIVISAASFPTQIAAAEERWNKWFSGNKQQEGRRTAYQAFKLYLQRTLSAAGRRDTEDSDELDKLVYEWSHSINVMRKTQPYAELFPYLGAALLNINLADATKDTLARDKTQILNRLHDVRITAGEGAKLLTHIENVEAMEAKKGTDVNSDEEPATNKNKRKTTPPQQNPAGGKTDQLAGPGIAKPYPLKKDSALQQPARRSASFSNAISDKSAITKAGPEAKRLLVVLSARLQDAEDAGAASPQFDSLFSKEERATLSAEDKAVNDAILQHIAGGFGIDFPPGDADKSGALEVLREYMEQHKAEYFAAEQELPDNSSSSETEEGAGSGSGSGSGSDSEPEAPPVPARDEEEEEEKEKEEPVAPKKAASSSGALTDEQLVQFFANGKEAGHKAFFKKAVQSLQRAITLDEDQNDGGESISTFVGELEQDAGTKSNFTVLKYRVVEVIAGSYGVPYDVIIAATPAEYAGYTEAKFEKARFNEPAKKLLKLIRAQMAKNVIPQIPAAYIPAASMIGNAIVEAHHPWNAFIHHTYRPVAGRFPEYYDRMHTKADMSPSAAYVGDAAETHRAYQLYSGTPISPPGYVIGCAQHEAAKKKEEEEEEKPIAAAAAPTPVARTVAPRTKRVDIRQKMRSKLTVIASTVKAPPVVRVQEEAEEVDTMIDDEFAGLPTCASFDF